MRTVRSGLTSDMADLLEEVGLSDTTETTYYVERYNDSSLRLIAYITAGNDLILVNHACVTAVVSYPHGLLGRVDHGCQSIGTFDSYPLEDAATIHTLLDEVNDDAVVYCERSPNSGRIITAAVECYGALYIGDCTGSLLSIYLREDFYEWLRENVSNG